MVAILPHFTLFRQIGIRRVLNMVQPHSVTSTVITVNETVQVGRSSEYIRAIFSH